MKKNTQFILKLPQFLLKLPQLFYARLIFLYIAQNVIIFILYMQLDINQMGLF